jgi:cell division protein FtsB
MKKTFILLFFSIALLSYSVAFAVEVAPRISDREIIEGLADIRGDIKKLEEGQKALQQQVNDLKESNNKRFDDINSRFDDLRWMFSIFITISLVILGFVLRMQWQMHRRQTQVETTLETQKDEISFLKNLIEKLLPPRGVL